MAGPLRLRSSQDFDCVGSGGLRTGDSSNYAANFGLWIWCLLEAFAHTGGRASITGIPAGGVNWKAPGGAGALGTSPVKVKPVMAPSISSISMAVMAPSFVTVRVRRG